MKFRTGIAIGFALGYYLGAKAGRERYIEMEAWLDKLRGTTQYLDARSKLDDLYDVGRRRTRGLLDDATGGAAGTLLDLRTPTDDDTAVDEPTA